VRRIRALALVVALLGLGLVPAMPSSAMQSSATTYYDYWSYWHKPPGATTWQYSSVGASGYYLQPDHPQVEGWRFGVGTGGSSDPKPRPVDVTYDDYCAGHDTAATYRVLLVVDYGTQSGAPAGPVYSCYGTDTQPNGRDVLLAAKHTERDSGGLICGIDNYPKSGCGDVVSSPAPKARKASAPPPPPTSPATTTSMTTAAASSSNAPSVAPRRTAASKAATPTAAATAPTTSTPADSSSIVAAQFVPPHRRGGVPYGFVAGSVFMLALIGAAMWQRRRRPR
jgi:hypothetical protein